MDRLNRIKVAVLLAVFFPAAVVMAETASVLLEEGIYAEQTEGDLDKAMSIYNEIIEQHQDEQTVAARATFQLGMCHLKKGDKAKAADYFRKVVSDYPDQKAVIEQAKEQFSKIYPGQRIVERSVAIARPAVDPATLMPANTIIYVEMGSPGKQVETIVNMLKGTPLENPLALVGGVRGGRAGNMLGALFNPSMLAEFKKIRGSAFGITGFATNNPPLVVFLDPGESDALRGLIMAALGAAGVAGEPIEGMQTLSIDNRVGVAYDEQVIMIAQPSEQLQWSVRQYKGITNEPTLASQNKSFSRIGREVRQSNAMTIWADVDTIFAGVKKQFGTNEPPQEFKMADYFVDFEGIDDVLGYLSVEPSGIAAEVEVNFKEGHRCLAYDMIRTPNIKKKGLSCAPERSAAIMSFAYGESTGPAVERTTGSIRRLTGLDIGREIYANIEQVTVFVMPPESAGDAGKSAVPVLPNVGVAFTSHDPQQSRLILDRILKSAEVATGGSSDVEPGGAAGISDKYVLKLNGGRELTVQVAQVDKTTVVALGPGVLDASLSALKGTNSVVNTGALGEAISQLPDDTSKVLMTNVGGQIRLADAYGAIPYDDANETAQRAVAELARAFDGTCVQVRTSESPNRLGIRASISGLPPVDKVYGPAKVLLEAAHKEKAKWTAKSQASACIIKAGKVPVIDGTAEEVWSEARQYELKNVIYSPIQSPNDLAASYRAMWDEDNLYVFIDVTDDKLVSDSSADEWWFDDSVEVYIDADNSKSNQYNDNDAQYHFDWDRTNPTMGVHNQHGRTENVEFAMVTTEKGYRAEIKFPWKTLGTKPAPGTSIGLDVHVNDDDDGGQRDTKLSWHDSQDAAWDNPQAFGNAELAGLVGWWKFDESQGNIAKDSSTGKHDGVLVGDAKWTKGRIGGAIELDGNGDFVKIPDEHAFDMSGEITIACWVSFRSVPYDYTAIVTKGDDSWRLSTSERQRKFHASVTGWDQLVVDGSTEVPANQWHHVTAVYDGKQLCIYVDGKTDVCQNWTGGIGQNDYEVLIGENAQEQGRFFDGLIDDVQIYNYALSKAEIEKLAQGQ